MSNPQARNTVLGSWQEYEKYRWGRHNSAVAVAGSSGQNDSRDATIAPRLNGYKQRMMCNVL